MLLTVSSLCIASYLTVSCLFVECPSLDNPENGEVHVTENGVTALYICDSGFTLIGKPKADCIAGNWSSEPPLCKKPQCNH